MSPRLRTAIAFLFLLIAGYVCASLIAGCSAEQLAAFSHDHPKAGATTQAVENAQQHVDKAAEVVIRVAPAIEQAADTAKGFGLPFTDWIKYGATAAAGLGAWWIGRRKPVAQLAQVIKGVEDAFPNKTEEQKLKLAGAMDQSTQSLVGSIKPRT